MRHRTHQPVLRTAREGVYLEYNLSVECRVSPLQDVVRLIPEDGHLPIVWFSRRDCAADGQLSRMIREVTELDGKSSPASLLLICELEGPLPPYGLRIHAVFDQKEVLCQPFGNNPPTH